MSESIFGKNAVKLLLMPQPSEPNQVFVRQNYYGDHYTVYITQKETPYPDGRLITSRTNVEGIITHANDAFVELSGWTREELMGCPHSVLRHPDMPSAIFEDLWGTLCSGRKWHGYVKNLRKDGGFYWVYATVIPNVREGKIVGYTSVRRKPSREKISEISEFYAELRAKERDIPLE